jgi:hypothetical protein
VQQADSLPDLREQLLAAFGELPERELADVMQVAFAAAHLAGRYQVQQGE